MLQSTSGANKERHLWHLHLQHALDVVMEEDAGKYQIRPEQELTRGPLRVDFLVYVKKDRRMKSRFGKLLKKYSIIEYKGATDNLRLKDFFSGLAHAFQYLVSGTGDSGKFQKIPGIQELLLVFIYKPYPRKLMKFLDAARVPIVKAEPGIWRFRVIQLDVMIVVHSLLEGEEYLWLKNLCRFPNPKDFNRMARQAIESPDDALRDLLIQFIAEVNPELWRKKTCVKYLKS